MHYRLLAAGVEARRALAERGSLGGVRMTDTHPAPRHDPATLRANARWQLDVVLLVGALGVLLLAAVMTPSDDALTLFGVEIPMVCTIRRLTGMSCPGCGLTRSFVYMAHGAPLAAFRMNLLGPPLFAVVALQVPWRALSLARRGRPARS